MSIEYQFVRKKAKDDSKELLVLLESERDALGEKLKAFAVEHPDMEDNVEGIIFELQRAMSSLPSDPGRDDHIIGMAVSHRFDWRYDNGFYGVADVQKFLEENPGYVIQNEYGSELSLVDFKASIKDLADGI